MEKENLRMALNKNFNDSDYLIKFVFRDYTKEEVLKSVQTFIDKYRAGNEECKYIFIIKEIRQLSIYFIVRLIINNLSESKIENNENDDCLMSIENIEKTNGSFRFLADYLLSTGDCIGGFSKGLL